MTRVTGTVLAVADDRAVVECATPTSACDACASGTGCRGLTLARQRPRTLDVALPAGMECRTGDTVDLVVDETRLLRAALRLYLPPLAGLLAAPALLHVVDGAAGARELAAAATGLLAGLAVARHWTRRVPVVSLGRRS